jgi:hypothetical protein
MQSISRNNFGGQLGAALGSGINELAELKLAQLTKLHEQQKERSDFAKTWEPILGKQSANFLSNLPPKERRMALNNLDRLSEAFQQPEPGRQQNGLAALAQQNQQFGGQRQQQQQRDPYQELLQAARAHTGPIGALGGAQQQPQFGIEEPQQQAFEQQQYPEQREVGNERVKAAQRIFESPKDRAAREKLEFAQRQANVKETKEYVDALKNKEKAAKEADLRLKRMETLIDKGNLPNAALWSGLSKLEHAPFISGLTAPFAELLKGGVKWYSGNPADIEEFEKLSSEFVKNAKQYFGSRITQKEVELFMNTVPSLMQTDSGKKKLIENIRSLNELSEIEAKAARSIIKANGGVPPIDIEQQVQDMIGNKLDKVAKEFIKR